MLQLKRLSTRPTFDYRQPKQCKAMKVNCMQKLYSVLIIGVFPLILCRLYATKVMVGCVESELRVMRSGLHDVIPSELLSSLTPEVSRRSYDHRGPDNLFYSKLEGFVWGYEEVRI